MPFKGPLVESLKRKLEPEKFFNVITKGVDKETAEKIGKLPTKKSSHEILKEDGEEPFNTMAQKDALKDLNRKLKENSPSSPSKITS